MEERSAYGSPYGSSFSLASFLLQAKTGVALQPSFIHLTFSPSAAFNWHRAPAFPAHYISHVNLYLGRSPYPLRLHFQVPKSKLWFVRNGLWVLVCGEFCVCFVEKLKPRSPLSQRITFLSPVFHLGGGRCSCNLSFRLQSREFWFVESVFLG